MAKKKPSDVNVTAFEILQAVTSQSADISRKGKLVKQPVKNPAAVALGRLGGKKGGPARAAKLSAKKRKEIAKNAALARWGQA